MWPIHYLNLTNLRVLRFSLVCIWDSYNAEHSCVQSYNLMEATGLEPVTAMTLLLFQLSYASIWKWALRINPLEPLFSPSQTEWVVYRHIITHDCVKLNGFQTMVRDREVESLRLTATDFESVVAAITPIPHIYLKPTSYLIAISSIGSWMMLSIPIPFIMPNRLTGVPYLALGNYAIYSYLIYLTHVPYIMMAVHLTPFTTAPVFPSPAFSW